MQSTVRASRSKVMLKATLSGAISVRHSLFGRGFRRRISNDSRVPRRWRHIPSAEIEYARSVMRKQPDHVLGTSTLTDNQPSLIKELYAVDDDSILEGLEKVFDDIENRSAVWTDEELLDALVTFARVTKCTQNPRESVRHALGAACAARCQQWSIERLFLVCDAWCSMHSNFRSDFSTVICNVMIRHMPATTASQMVQAIFYATRLAGPLAGEQQCNNVFDARLAECYTQLSLDELGVVALSYFRQSFDMDSKVVTYIYERLLKTDALDEISDMTLVSFLKLLRWAEHNAAQRELHMALQQRLIGAAASGTLTIAMKSVLLGTKTRICNDELLGIVVQRCLKHINDLRLKDFEGISLAVNLFNFKSASGIETRLLKAILNELETSRHDEISEYPRMHVQCQRYLAYAGIHSNRLISDIFEPTNLTSVYGDVQNYPHEIRLLDSYVKINLKDSYRGPRLSEEQCAQLKRKFCAPNPMAPDSKLLSRTDELAMDIWRGVQKTYRHCVRAHILPHCYRPRIFLAVDAKTKRSVQISHRFPPYRSSAIMHKDQLTDGNTQLEIISILLASEHAYVHTKDGHRLTGGFWFEINQLKLLGFRPLVIPYSEWSAVPKTKHHGYLIGKINATLNAAKIYS